MLDWDWLYSDVDDFCRVFEPAWERQLLEAGIKHRVKASALTLSEVMTLIIAFQVARYRDFKHFYIDFGCRYHRDAFPNLVSYSRFVELMPSALVPLCCLLHTRRGRVTGIAYIDSTSLEVCHPKRAHAHRVLAEGASWGKTTAQAGSTASSSTSSSMMRANCWPSSSPLARSMTAPQCRRSPAGYLASSSVTRAISLKNCSMRSLSRASNSSRGYEER